MTESKSNTSMTYSAGKSDGGWNILGAGQTLYFSTTPNKLPKVKRVEFHNRMVTVVYWEDNTVTRVKTGKNDVFNEEYGLAMAVAKKMYGSYDRFAWSLSKAKHYENGKRVKK